MAGPEPNMTGNMFMPPIDCGNDICSKAGNGAGKGAASNGTAAKDQSKSYCPFPIDPCTGKHPCDE